MSLCADAHVLHLALGIEVPHHAPRLQRQVPHRLRIDLGRLLGHCRKPAQYLGAKQHRFQVFMYNCTTYSRLVGGGGEGGAMGTLRVDSTDITINSSWCPAGARASVVEEGSPLSQNRKF